MYNQEELEKRYQRKLKLYKKISDKRWNKWCIIKLPEYNFDCEVLFAKPDAHTWSAYIENSKRIIPIMWTANMCSWKLIFTPKWSYSEILMIDWKYTKEKYNESFNEYITRIETIWQDVTYWYILDLLKKYNKSWYFCENCKQLDNEYFVDDWYTWCKKCKNEMIYITDYLYDLWNWYNSSLLKQSIECIEFLEKIFINFDINKIKEQEYQKQLDDYKNFY